MKIFLGKIKSPWRDLTQHELVERSEEHQVGRRLQRQISMRT